MLIYTITNSTNGKKYVGQTITSLNRRITCHKATAKISTYPLYNAFKKYGLDSFIVEQIDTAATREELDTKEIFWINQLNTLVPNGYNIQSGGQHGGPPKGKYAGKNNPMFGKTQSQEGKRRIGEAARKRMSGRIVSEETRKKLRQNATGVAFTEERKRAISEGKKGKPAWNKGKPGIIPTEETRQKMSAAHTGKIRAPYTRKPHSAETRQKMSAAAKGKPSPLKGRTFSEERRKKQSEAIRLWHQKKLTSE